ncbi:DUF4426 domain-containing protein [Algiphilus sp.]|uniref:DUF4426 domain-containing protein n=1 Tax=Algiphilus sp. TaxID=1872431 RepID=UPI0025BEFF3E|nr:DUF4426 domain-containing protein [Algiphilus sp.]MCK5770601.1 DUF4426 domain-containing protein [Algiphilus sp.]
MMRYRCTAMTLLLAIAGVCAAENGGQSVVRDGFEIHYAALGTMDIPAETARAVQVTRSANRMLLVLNAQRADDAASVRATAEGTVTNIVGQAKTFEPRVVEDNGVWYVLADFRVSGGERLRFDLAVTPEGASAPIPVRFQQTFYPPR